MSPELSFEPLGCVVAGGRSTRMGRDKGSIVLGGESLLLRAVRTLKTVCDLVVVSGAAASVPSVVAQIVDEESGRGPLGGAVSALRFAASHRRDWVMFLPVDMPLLPAGLVGALLQDWRRAVGRGAWVCCAESDGIIQPLISLVHRDALPTLKRLLAAGDLRVRPGLHAAAAELAAARGTDADGAFYRTRVRGDGPEALAPPGWRPSEVEWARRAQWFSNVNTPEDLEAVRRALGAAVSPDETAAEVAR